MAGGAAAAGAAAAAAAAAAAEHARRLLVGGLLIEIPADRFQHLAAALDGPVVTGIMGSFFSKKRLYFIAYNGMTFYCKVKSGRRLAISAIEVPHIDKGPLKL